MVIELPVVNKVTNTLVAGHGRIAALQNMAGRGESMPKYLKKEDDTQEWLIPTVVVEFETDAEAKAYIVASNQLTIDGSWNESAAARFTSRYKCCNTKLIRNWF